MTSFKKFVTLFQRHSSKDFLYSPVSQPVAVYILYGFFWLNAVTLKNTWLEGALWQWLRLELFYIGGACRHSGNCCRGIMLFSAGKSVSNHSQFQKLLARKPAYRRFNPISAASEEISHFNCDCLSADNRCSDYENRPDLCRAYPATYFIQHGHILAGCGYRVLPRTFFPRFSHPRFKIKIDQVFEKNQLRRGI